MVTISRRVGGRLGVGVAALALLGALASAPSASAATTPAALRDVLLVGNSASGTVSVLDGHTFANLGSFNVVPDLAQRLAEINADPVRWAAYQLVRSQEG